MTVSVTTKTHTYSNGTANDATYVDADMTTLFNNDQTLANSINNDVALKASANSFTNTNTFSAKATFSALINTLKTSEPATYAGGDLWYSQTYEVFEGAVEVATIAGATNASPIVITTNSANPLQSGDTVCVSGVFGNTGANGTFIVTVIDSTHFSLNSSTGTGGYSGGGSIAQIQKFITDKTSPSLYRFSGFSADTTVTTGQKGYYFDFTGSTDRTLTFPSSSSMGLGWYCFVRNSSTAVLTLTPNGAETVTYNKVYPGESIVVTTDGSNLKTLGNQPRVLLLSQTAGGAASVSFASTTAAFYNSNFKRIIFKGTDVIPATDNQDLWLRVSEDSGATFKSGGTDYGYGVTFFNTGTGSQAANSDSKILIGRQLSNGSDGSCFELILENPSSTTTKKAFRSAGSFAASGGVYEVSSGWGRYKGTANAVNGVQFLMASGNISGYFEMWGER